MNKRVTILGVAFDALSRAEAEERFAALVSGGGQHLVVTPNPEMCVLAQSDAEFAAALAGASLSLPDGTGLLFASRLGGRRIPERITGADFLESIARLSAERGWSVFFLGGHEGVAAAAADALKKKHARLLVAGAEPGGRMTLSSDGWPVIDGAVLGRIRAAAPSILVAAFGGARGVQEKWLAKTLPELPSVRAAIGVGGALDFWSGRIPRAPQWMRGLGLEWLYRLWREPSRWRRILTAVAVFPWMVVRKRPKRGNP